MSSKQRAIDQGFVLSDHADWDGLIEAVQATGAEHVYVTHGYTEVFKRWLQEQAYDAHIVETLYKGESIVLPDANNEKGEA